MQALSALLTAVATLAGAALNTLFGLLALWGSGGAAAARLARRAWGARKAEGGLAAALPPLLLAPAGQRDLFAAMRAFWPTVRLERQLATAYPNTGTVIVTRRADVLEVLRRDDAFEVVYEPRMREITAGENFFLGMQPGHAYERDTAAMRLAMKRTDADAIVKPRMAALATAALADGPGEIDVVRALTRPIAADMVDSYFGLPHGDHARLADWATDMFWFLFNDLGADPAVGARARAAATDARDWIDGCVATGEAGGDTLLGRCLALRDAGVEGMDAPGVRNNLIGLVIGAIPTLSKAATLALDELLSRPAELRAACNAAKAGDEDLVARHLWEALRFNPHNPVIYRRAVHDTRIASATLRSRAVPAGTMVFAANASAMFDPLDIPSPGQFRTDRPWESYIHWGWGMHRCFGDAVNLVAIPAMLTPLLARGGLERVSARDDGGTPFPQALRVRYAA